MFDPPCRQLGGLCGWALLSCSATAMQAVLRLACDACATLKLCWLDSHCKMNTALCGHVQRCAKLPDSFHCSCCLMAWMLWLKHLLHLYIHACLLCMLGAVCTNLSWFLYLHS
jgi:hypothetical protein